MSSMHHLQLPASPTGAGLPGCWTLPRERAITLDARKPGYLRVAHGAIWVTMDGPHVQGAANDWGDLVLRSGARIRLVPGQPVVLEPYPDAANEDAGFSWEPEVLAPAPAESRWARLWQRLRSAFGDGLLQWLEPGPGWPRQAVDFRARERGRAWRRLYHLGIHQP